jgi:hypothetical protein
MVKGRDERNVVKLVSDCRELVKSLPDGRDKSYISSLLDSVDRLTGVHEYLSLAEFMSMSICTSAFLDKVYEDDYKSADQAMEAINALIEEMLESPNGPA